MSIVGPARPVRFVLDGETEPIYEGWFVGENMAGIDVLVDIATFQKLTIASIGILNSVDVSEYADGYFVDPETGQVKRLWVESWSLTGPLVRITDCSFQEVKA